MADSTSLPLPLTPEQTAAISDGGGLAYAYDPNTNRRYALLDCQVETSHSDEYLRELIAEGIAQLDRGEGIPWDVNELKARLAERLQQRDNN